MQQRPTLTLPRTTAYKRPRGFFSLADLASLGQKLPFHMRVLIEGDGPKHINPGVQI